MRNILKLWWLARQLSNKNNDWRVRQRAVEKLGNLYDTRAVELLAKALNDKSVRLAAVIALGKLGGVGLVKPQDKSHACNDATGEAKQLLDKLVVEPLIIALSCREDVELQRTTAIILGELGDVRAVEPLIKLLKNSFSHEADAAALALGKIGDVRAVEPLIQYLKEMGSTAAEEALGNIGDVRAVEPLILLLEHFNESVRRAVVVALGILGDARSVVPLISMLGDGNRDVRMAASESLSKLGQPMWEKWVRGDKEDWKRLAEAHEQSSAEPLIKALDDENSDVRVAAAEALGILGDAENVATLIRRIQVENDKIVLQSIIQALGELRDVHSAECLVDVLTYGSREICQDAAGALVKISAKALGCPEKGSYLINIFFNAVVEEIEQYSAAMKWEKVPIFSGIFHTLGEEKWSHLLEGDRGAVLKNLTNCGNLRLERASRNAIIYDLTKNLYSNSYDTRLATARELIAYYQSGAWAWDVNWHNISSKIKSPHQDHNLGRRHDDSYWPPGCLGSDAHTDHNYSGVHTDDGIGLDFPEKPPSDSGNDKVPDF
jgi:HEAT repeat protein